MFSLYPGGKSSRFSKKLDSFFWFFLKLLPIILMFIVEFASYRSGNPNDETLAYYIDKFIDIPSYNRLYVTIENIFGASSALQFFDFSPYMAYYLCYLVFIELAHLFYDVIVFIPRLARKWLNISCQDDL